MKIELKFHHDTRFEYVQWRQSLGATNAQRSEWEKLLLAALVEHLEKFDGIPPEAKFEDTGLYTLHYSNDIRIQYQLVDPIKGRSIVSKIKRWLTRPVWKVVILSWDRNAS